MKGVKQLGYEQRRIIRVQRALRAFCTTFIAKSCVHCSSKWLTFMLSLFMTPCLSAQQQAKTMLRFPDTGQITDYTQTFGEDSDYRQYVPAYFILQPDIVLDSISNLEWQRVDGGELSYEQAQHYVDTLRIGGHSDWRLPSLMESLSILNLDRLNPAMDQSAFPTTGAEYWWTSEVHATDTTKVWVTNSGGGSGPHPKSESISAGGTKRFHVRAVRDRQPPSLVERFIDNGDGSFRDQLFGLVWCNSVSTDSMTWDQALQYAEKLDYAGHTDWRLPNIKELCSIVDRTRNAPAINTAFVHSAPSTRYWSSTSQYKQAANAWFVDLKSSGLSSYDPKILRHSVLCVRDDKTTSSIDDQDGMSDSEISLNPKPVAEYLLLEVAGLSCENGCLEIVDVQGRLRIRSSFKRRIDCCGLESGLYLIKVSCAEHCLRYFFVKE